MLLAMQWHARRLVQFIGVNATCRFTEVVPHPGAKPRSSAICVTRMSAQAAMARCRSRSPAAVCTRWQVPGLADTVPPAAARPGVGASARLPPALEAMPLWERRGPHLPIPSASPYMSRRQRVQLRALLPVGVNPADSHLERVAWHSCLKRACEEQHQLLDSGRPDLAARWKKDIDAAVEKRLRRMLKRVGAVLSDWDKGERLIQLLRAFPPCRDPSGVVMIDGD